MPTSASPLHTALERHFGFREFRPGQQAIIEAVLAGRDTLAIMPTGRGKSLCYQLPALMLPGTTLVISPLIALMKDQVDALLERGIPATYINSSLDPEIQRERLDMMAMGRYKLVYIAPERFRSQAFVEALRQTTISLVAVDEAHCLSQWGHDFRPDYMKLARALAQIGAPQVLAATATATSEVREDVLAQLRLRDPAVFVSGFDRPNLRYMVRYTPNEAAKLEKLAQITGWVQGGGIVYCATRKNVEKVADFLSQSEPGVVAYHAGLDERARAAAQDRFISGRARLVVATNAFGMGIDRPDVRVVVHYDIPGTLEAYYQEAGRAGRDGRMSYCVLLFQESDRYLQEFFIEGSSPGPDIIQAVYNVLTGEGSDQVFLTQAEIAARLPRKVNDMAIGTCLNVLERMGVIERLNRQDNQATAKFIPWAHASVKGKLQTQVLLTFKDRFGPALQSGIAFDLDAAAAWTGLSREQVHQSLKAMAEKGLCEYTPPFQGRGVEIKQRVALEAAGLDRGFWATKRDREVGRLDQMIHFAYHQQCRRRYMLSYFGDVAPSGPCGGCDVCLGIAEAPATAARAAKPTKRAPKAAAGPAAAAGEAPESLVTALRSLRMQLAKERNLPAYVVATDATLLATAVARPQTEAELLNVKGWGMKKVTLYGEPFLQVLQEYGDLPAGVEGPVFAPSETGLDLTQPVDKAEADEPDHRQKQKLSVEKLRETIVEWVLNGAELAEIAAAVNRSPSTVEGHIVTLVESGELEAERFVDAETAAEIRRVADTLGERKLRLIKDAFGDAVSYLQIRIALCEDEPSGNAVAAPGVTI